ncbi:MAG TPA: S8 family serine peptidase [Candidatus Polarisedimenticolia bacterium]|nr:S8 family serine peptidase [Candidatus Polarisedimenticolia bacterium]
MRRRAAALLLAPLPWMAWPGGPQASPASSHPIRMMVARTPAIESLAASGAIEVIDEYGPPGPRGFYLVRGAASALVPWTASGGEAVRPVRSELRLRSRTLDTSSPRLAAPAPAGPGGVEVIQFHGPVKREWLRRLRAAGVRPLSYLAHDGYLVWSEEGSNLAAAELPLQWRQPLERSDRLDPGLAAAAEPVAVSIQIVRAGRHPEVLEEIRSRALSILHEPRAHGELITLRARMPPEAIQELAARREVLWIEPFETAVLHDERSALIVAGHVAASRPGPPGHEAWLEAHGLSDLSGVVVDVADTGIDTGDTALPHPGLAGRYAYAQDMTGEGQLQDCAGHGTNMAGIIAGGSWEGDSLDAEGYLLGLGVAPSARVGSSRIFTCSGALSPAVSFTELAAAAAARGARISNNSWGASGSQYNTVTAEYDAIVRDADGDPGNGDQPLLPVFSAGNQGPLPNTVGWPASAKNVLAAGATEGYRPGQSDGCGTQGLLADNANHILGISARGPAGDGRVKPDLVAPGSHIQSLASRALGYSGVGVCDKYFPPGQRLLNWATGTSQSAAHASGAAAVAVEVARRLNGRDPSPALIKAMLIAHARDMGNTSAVPSNTTHRPNPAQGWGRVDLSDLVEGVPAVSIDQETILTETGSSVIHAPIAPADPDRPVVVALVWTDAPGTPGGWAWVNDLDLIVRTGDAVYLGNVLSEGISVTGGTPDFRNNVELVVLPPGSATLSVEVRASSLGGDGLPGVPGETDQDFALHVANARLARPEAALAAGDLHPDCGGTLPLVLTERGLIGAGRALVEVRGARGDRETAVLLEQPAGSGIFAGAIDLAEGPPSEGDGVVGVVDGESITAIYWDPSPGGGDPVPRSASAAASCGAPAISELRVARAGDTEALITWRTDRPADSSVSYGAGSVLSSARSDPKLVLSHAVRLTGLKPCTLHSFTAGSQDQAGRSSTSPIRRFSTGAGGTRRRTLFRDDMEGFASRWTHRPLGQGVDDWQLGFPSAAPSGPFSGTRVWGTVLGGEYSRGLDAVLESPPIDLREAVGPQLTFLHHHALSGGRPPMSENDGAWVEVSSDGGATWSAIDPIGGYPDTIDPDNGYLPAGSPVYAGSSGTWQKPVFDLSAFSGALIRVRFHVWQDPSENNPRLSGWYLDDVAVTTQAPCHEGRLLLDAEEYGCSGTAKVSLWETDANRSATAVETLRVTASSPAVEIEATLVETGPDTGEFVGAVPLAEAPPAGLAVSEGDTLTLRYQDPDAGGGAPSTVSVSALVGDCTPPPAPASVTVPPGPAPGRLTVTWSAVDPGAAPDLQGYRVHYDTDGSGPAYYGTGALQGASPVRAEPHATSLGLSSLGACVPHFVSVTSFDRLGNESGFAPEAVAMPPGPAAPCSFAKVSVSPPVVSCNQFLGITVADANADGDGATAGSVTVTAVSATQQDPVAVQLVETGPATGQFTGALSLSRSPAPGVLAVATGDAILVRYEDADDGVTGLRLVEATASTGDCDPPVLSGLRAGARAANRTEIRWTTDEPATSIVRFGPDLDLERQASDSALSTDHSILLTGLASCSTVWFSAGGSDAAGNASLPGAPMKFGVFRDIPLASDDLESGAAGWTHSTLGAASDEWELGLIPQDPNAIPQSLRSNATTVWGTDLDGFYDEGANMVLVTPPLDLTSARTATLTFRHWYDIHSSGPPTGFDDGGFVEISDDSGATWSVIQPLGGYPDTIDGAPGSPPMGAYAGVSPDWTTASFILDAYAGKVVRIRFHLREDPVFPLTESPRGWYLDDLLVTFAEPCHEGVLEWDRPLYGCQAPPARLRLADVDLDATLEADTVQVTALSGGEPAGEPVLLAETGPGTGVFEGAIPLRSVDAPGTLLVLPGDTITAVYDDLDDGSGSPAAAAASASVGDCAGPLITDVRVTETAAGQARVQWRTSEPADSAVLYGLDPSLGSIVSSTALTLEHDLILEELQVCARYHLTVASADALGNTAREDATAPQRILLTSALLTLLSEPFDEQAAGWVSTGQGNTWVIASTEGSSAARTGPETGPYSRPADLNADFVLTSPILDVSGAERPALVLRHAYDFPTTFQAGDGGWVEGWDGVRWTRLTPEGGYPRFVDPEAGRTGVREPAFAGASGGFITSRFDLSALASAAAGLVRVRLRVFVEAGAGPTGTGWTIDHLSITADGSCHAGRLALQGLPFTCASSQAGLSLHDRDLDADPSAVDTATIAVESTGGPAPMAIQATETAPSSGWFTGTVALDPEGGPGTLRAAPGDTLTARYLDQDAGLGQPAEAAASALVRGCAGPILRNLTASSAGHGGLMVRWATTAPATSEVAAVAPTGLPALSGRPALVTSHRVELSGLAPCTSYEIIASSVDADGVRGEASTAAETTRRTVLFLDDMEGPDPGWASSGPEAEWERGAPAPAVGPPGPFSGARVYATDLDAFYDGGTDATLTSPPIDLRGVAAARLAFWHWYDVFGSDSPNSFDDAAWVEVQPAAGPAVRIEPIGGYTDVTDQDAGRPLPLGTPVYAGQSEDWERAEFDLSPFAGQVVRIRFRIWNDVVELLVNGRTGAGWYLDDVEVSAPLFCVPAPAVSSASFGQRLQGETVSSLELHGSGFRPGARVALGPGVQAAAVAVEEERIVLDIAVSPRAALGPRELTVINPDGQSSTLPEAMTVVFSPARADADGSGRIDIGDLVILAEAFGSLEGDARYDPAADLDGDGAVDGFDLALLASRFGASF